MSAPEKILAALALFTVDEPVWNAEAAAARLGVSISTCYRYFALLSDAGFVTTVSTGHYTLGPSIIELDRQIQITDPLLLAARPIMKELLGYAPPGTVMLLCRYYGDRVLCVQQVSSDGVHPEVSYERGRPMPLFLGATSKAILAHLSYRQLRKLFAAHQSEIAAAGLGREWSEFRSALAALRRANVVVTRHEVDPDKIGIAAPICNEDGTAVASLSFVVDQSSEETTPITRLGALIASSATDIAAALQARK